MMNTLKSFTYVALAGTIFFSGMVATGCAASDHAMKKEAMAKEAPAFNDLEIAHIAYTAGAIDIRYAHLALALSEDPEVLEFAELMVRDHTAVNKKALALVKKLNIMPQDNAMSQQLLKGAADIRQELSQLRGEAFAKRYAANELGYHKTVNGVVENTFIPTAQNAELKALLKGALQTFKVHQGHAESMNAKVQKS
ncbi:MAG: DUF4142 domain-containing protein [Nitrospirales bacterium]